MPACGRDEWWGRGELQDLGHLRQHDVANEGLAALVDVAAVTGDRGRQVRVHHRLVYVDETAADISRQLAQVEGNLMVNDFRGEVVHAVPPQRWRRDEEDAAHRHAWERAHERRHPPLEVGSVEASVAVVGAKPNVENRAGMAGQPEHACQLAEASRGWGPP